MKRYDITCCDEYEHCNPIVECDDGDYIKYSEHNIILDELSRENERKKAEYAELFEGYKEKDRVFCDAVIENAALRARLAAAEKELAEYKGKVERAIEWLNENIINYCPECSLEIDIIDWDALEQILQGTDK